MNLYDFKHHPTNKNISIYPVRSRSMKHSEFSLTSADGLSLYGQRWDPDENPKGAIALVHGLGEHTGRYGYVAQRLTQAGYALCGIDLRGHGKSDGPRGHSPSLDAMLDDIELLVKYVQHQYSCKAIFLYGHSMGGSLVLNEVLRRHPVIQGVISTSPGLATAKPVAPVTLALGKIMYRLNLTMQLDNGLDRSGLSRDPSVVEAYSKDPLVHGKISARFALDFMAAGQYALQHASEFPLPLLLEQGSEDRLVSPQTTKLFAETAANCTFKWWEGLYHETHNEPEKDAVLDVMINWLNDHLA
jgi:alpha-beta hydrolase superfamily lysophospholipase